MMAQQKLVHVFRRPRYPVLCSVAGDLIAAFSLQQLERRLSRVNTAADDVLDMIDATGEGWAVHIQLGTVSPLTLHKNWRKAELLNLYRDSATRHQAGVPCEDKALMRRRLDELVLVIADVLRLTSRCSRRGPRRFSDNGSRRVPARAAERQR